MRCARCGRSLTWADLKHCKAKLTPTELEGFGVMCIPCVEKVKNDR